MQRGRTTVLLTALLALAGAGVGCSDKPHSYGKERPPIVPALNKPLPQE